MNHVLKCSGKRDKKVLSIYSGNFVQVVLKELYVGDPALDY